MKFILNLLFLIGISTNLFSQSNYNDEMLRTKNLRYGNGTPEGVITAIPGTVYQNTNSSTASPATYEKKSGTGNTGWIAANTGRMPIGILKGANFNSTSDQPITMYASNYIIRDVVTCNASLSLSLAAGGIYSAASKGGTAVVGAAQVYSSLSAQNKFLSGTLDASLSSTIYTNATLYLSLTVAQGSAATADLYIFGDIIP